MVSSGELIRCSDRKTGVFPKNRVGYVAFLYGLFYFLWGNKLLDCTVVFLFKVKGRRMANLSSLYTEYSVYLSSVLLKLLPSFSNVSVEGNWDTFQWKARC